MEGGDTGLILNLYNPPPSKNMDPSQYLDKNSKKILGGLNITYHIN